MRQSFLLHSGAALFAYFTVVAAQSGSTAPSPSDTATSGGTAFGTNKCSQAFAWECVDGVQKGCWWTMEGDKYILDMVTLPQSGPCAAGAVGPASAPGTPSSTAVSGAGASESSSGTSLSVYQKNVVHSTGGSDTLFDSTTIPVTVSSSYNAGSATAVGGPASSAGGGNAVASSTTASGGPPTVTAVSSTYNQPDMPTFPDTFACDKGKNYVMYWYAYAFPMNTTKQVLGGAVKCVTHIILFTWELRGYDQKTLNWEFKPIAPSLDMKPWASVQPNMDRTKYNNQTIIDPWTSREAFLAHPDFADIPKTAKIMPCFGGWGTDSAFRAIVDTPAHREDFLSQMGTIMTEGGWDGVDIDWEYPGGDGEAYKNTPTTGTMQNGGEILGYIDKFIDLLGDIRQTIGKDKELSIAVGARPVDIGYTVRNKEDVEKISSVVDYWNVMTYDYVNRRDSKIGGQALFPSGKGAIEAALGAYGELGLAKDKTRFGWVAYAKAFPYTDCDDDKVKQGTCMLAPMELSNGTDMSNSATIAFSKTWNYGSPIGAQTSPFFAHYFDVAESKLNSMPKGSLYMTGMDPQLGDETSYVDWFVDEDMKLVQSWVSPKKVEESCKLVLGDYAGVFMYALGEDFDDNPLTAMALASCISN